MIIRRYLEETEDKDNNNMYDSGDKVGVCTYLIEYQRAFVKNIRLAQVRVYEFCVL